MGIPTMMAGSIRNILLGAIEIKRDEFKAGKPLDAIRAELKDEGFSDHSSDRIMIEVQDKPIPDDFIADNIKDSYNIKENTIKIILRENPGLKIQDVVRYKTRDWVVQQINDYGSECEMLIKYYG